MKKIFITGISGCVGHYLFDLLSSNQNYQLFLLIRNLSKLKFNPYGFSQVVVINDDLKNIEKYHAQLREMDFLIHLAADWGGHEGNYDYPLTLFNLLDPSKCQKVIYFSTASILGPDGKPLEAAEKFGTNYIQSKYRFYLKLPELKIYPRVVTLFPTWVLGGDENHPYSHALQGIIDLRPWLWLIRFFTVDAKFHFIHAKDLARIALYLLENETKEKEFIVGNPAISARQLIKEVCEFFGYPIYFQVPIPSLLIQFLASIFRRKLHSWDLYCLNRKYFVYQAANASTFGLTSDLQTIYQIMLYSSRHGE
ncbi:MAG: NAD-dependent epimerase/dehydratase family protein [Candidatus Margulisiibacteriota bacterium]